MKILMALMGLEIGGAETHVIELVKELRKREHEVLVVSNGGVYETQLEACGATHVWAPLHRRRAKTMLQSLSILEQTIRREKPDLVHAHARIPAFLCGILQKKLHFPFITSAHWVFEVTPLLRLMTNWGQRTVAVSEDIKQYLMDSYGYPEDRIHVTINGIDTDTFAPGDGDAQFRRKLGLGEGPVICTVSRLDESREEASRKLIALTPALAEQFPQAQVLIVGGGNREAELRNMAEKVNGALGRNAVVMTGPRTDIARLVAVGDIFVGVSRAALEAMSMEKPTILAGNEGYTGIMTPEKLSAARESNFCCRGFDSIDENVLLQDILWLLQSPPETRNELGAFGRQVVLREYSVARMTDVYLQAYDRLLKKSVSAVISGYYGYGNLGDDAILLAISGQLKERDLPVQLTVLSRRPKETMESYGLFAVHRFSPMAVIQAIREADLLISGGGSLLQDKTSTRSLLYYLLVISLARLLGKPVFLYANGIGPVSGKANRKWVRKVLEACDVITLRDEESLETLEAFGLHNQNVYVTSDPAFSLCGEGDGQALLDEYGIPTDAPIIGVSVRSVPGSEANKEEFAVLCDKLAGAGRTVVFLVMQESADEAQSRAIQELMHQQSYLLKIPGEPKKMLSILHEMSVLVSMRLHAIIFAAVEGTPSLGCEYDPKVSALLRMLSLPSCGKPEEFSGEEAYAKVEHMLENREQLHRELCEKVTELRESAGETTMLLEKLLWERDLI